LVKAWVFIPIQLCGHYLLLFRSPRLEDDDYAYYAFI
jgi:hypothetical protein